MFCVFRWASPWRTLRCWWLPASALILWRCSPRLDTISPILWHSCFRWSLCIWNRVRQARPRLTVGIAPECWRRLLNAGSLVVVSFLIFYEAFRRLQNPGQVQAHVMIWVAAAGVVMNGVIALLLYRSGRDVNIRSALLHEIGDTVSTAAVIVGGWVILATGQYWIDSALSFGIGALILWSGFGICRETLNILLEGTPRGIRLDRVEAAMRSVEGVNDVHDLHVWNIGSETRALSCHISIEDIPPSVSERILRDVKVRLHEEFHIDHTTIQFEHVICEVAHGCVIPVSEGEHHGHSH